MAPLPEVHGTVGKIEPLLDTSLINRFADLPQDGGCCVLLLVVDKHACGLPRGQAHPVACWPPPDPLHPGACPLPSWRPRYGCRSSPLGCRMHRDCCLGLAADTELDWSLFGKPQRLHTLGLSAIWACDAIAVFQRDRSVPLMPRVLTLQSGPHRGCD